MAELPDISSLSPERLRELYNSEEFSYLPPRLQAQIRAAVITQGRAVESQRMQDIVGRRNQAISEADRQRREYEATMAERAQQVLQNPSAQLPPAPTPPQWPSPQSAAAPSIPAAPIPATPSAEDLVSQAIRTVVPPPAAPAPPAPPAPPAEERPARAAPTPAPVAAGGGGAPRVAPGEGAESRRARASGETADILKTLAEPERKPNIMDSPYTALINAGLNILMGGAGKSPLEAIATGGGAALKTLGEQAAREEARGEKRLDRAYKRAELGTKIRSEIQGLEQKEEQLRLELEKIVSQRANYASEAAHRAAILKVQERLADATEKRAEATDRLATVRETSMGIPGLQQNIRDLNARITARQRDRNQALQASERQRIDDEIDAARAELRGYMEEWSRITGGRMPAAPAAPTLPTQRVR
jgi:hypothetical protein